MSRRVSDVRIRVPLVLLVVSVACLFLVPSAGAGINPLKKAKDAVTKPAEKKAAPPKSDEQIVFDEVTLELTNARLDAMLSACKKAADAAAGRPALVEKLNKTSDDRAKLDEKHGEAVRDLQRRRSDVEVCYHDEYDKVIEKRTKEYAAKATSDPAILQEYSRIAQEQAMANAKGDSATLQRLNNAMMQWTAPTKEDSLKVKQKCGPIPPHSAAEDQLAAFDKQIASLNEQIRVVDENVAKALAKAGGMTQEQWGVARERLQGYIPAPGKEPPADPRGFTDDEIDALEKHLDQLREARSNFCL